MIGLTAFSVLTGLMLSTMPLIRAPEGERAGRWGEAGHVMSGTAAATDLPAEMPQFFRDAGRQLGYLNFEPDRWREGRLPEMNQAYGFDHYINLEVVTPSALEAQNRYQYLSRLTQAGMAEPERRAGTLPFRIIELHQRLTVQFSLWRRAPDSDARFWIEQRIIQDAGVLGHYVTDAANPHHSTIHANGWAAGAPNPNGYSTERTFHRRFEVDFVEAHIDLEDLLPTLRTPRLIDDPRTAVMDHIVASSRRVERLYELEKMEAFGPEARSPQHKEFAVERLSAGIAMLRDLWWTAWVRSGEM